MTFWRKDADTRLILVRHGQTPCSVERRFAGRIEVPLTEVGSSQAAQLGAWLGSREHIDAVYCSPQLRCRQTVEQIGQTFPGGLPGPDLHEGLVEMDYGQADGQPVADHPWMHSIHTQAPGGESIAQVECRVRAAVGEIAARHHGHTVLLVTHMTPIKAILRSAFGAGEDFYRRLHLDIAQVSVVQWGDPPCVTLVNSAEHL